jgi:hypothetical protein
MARSKQEPDGVRSADIRSRDESDVEGHAMHRGGEADGAKSSLTRSSLTRSSARGRDEGEDVEGHSMLINPGVSRDLAKARDADIQRSVRAHNQSSEAKRPYKK